MASARSVAAVRKRIHKTLDTYLDAVLALDKLKSATPRDANAIAEAARTAVYSNHEYKDAMERIIEGGDND